jgi:serpin B
LENADLQAIQLPYASNKLSMVVLLPRKPDALAGLEKSLSPKALGDWLGAMADRNVDTSLPKFTFTSHFSLGKTLQAMGMEEAFSSKADFSGINTDPGVRISDVIHQAFVDVNEEGTEAAAATGVAFSTMSMPVEEQKVVFRADHPFLFLIRDNASGTILFFGRVVNPKE